MKKITVENYKDDPYYPRIVRAVETILATGEVVTPIDVFIRMDLLSKEDVESWRFGRIPYLEKVIRCNLAKASRILRILRMHVHDLNMRPSLTDYRRWGKGSRTPLRFSKTGDPNLEEAYSRHFLSPHLKSRKKRGAEPNQPAGVPGVLPSIVARTACCVAQYLDPLHCRPTSQRFKLVVLR